MENAIQREMLRKNLILVGWYHSHPRIASQPTLRDCDTQLEYQIKMRGTCDATYTPCIGLICSPYFSENPTLESSITAYWIVPPPENRPMEYGRPMLMQFSVTQDAEMTEDIKTEMVLAIDYYKQFDNELIKFEAKYGDDSTYIEKLKTTLYSKFPREQNDFEFWNWLRSNLGLLTETAFTPPKWTKEETEAKESQRLSAENGSLGVDGIVLVETHTGIPMLSNSDMMKIDSNDDDSVILVHDSTRLDYLRDSSKEDKLSIRSLQEQLSLPSGLNMTPSPISTLPILQSTIKVLPNNSVAGTSPRDSPITIPSNSASPAKFDTRPAASPSPAKSDSVSIRNRNSPQMSASNSNKLSTQITNTGGGLSANDKGISSSAQNLAYLSKYGLDITGTSGAGDTSDMSIGTQSATNAMQDFISANFPSGYSTNDYTTLLQQSMGKEQTKSNSSSTSSAAALAQSTSSMKDFLAQLEKSSELSYLLQSQYPYSGMTGLPLMNSTGSSSQLPSSNTKSTKQSKRNSSHPRMSMSTPLQQKLLEEEFKNDTAKLHEFLRSQEYANMLVEQAEVLTAAAAHQNSYADLTQLLSAMNQIPSTPAPKKSRKSSTVSSTLSQPSTTTTTAELNQLMHGASPACAAKINDLIKQIETNTSLLLGEYKRATFITCKSSLLPILLQILKKNN